MQFIAVVREYNIWRRNLAYVSYFSDMAAHSNSVTCLQAESFVVTVTCAGVKCIKVDQVAVRYCTTGKAIHLTFSAGVPEPLFFHNSSGGVLCFSQIYGIQPAV